MRSSVCVMGDDELDSRMDNRYATNLALTEYQTA